MDGYQVMPMIKAAKIGDIFITVTGDIKVIDQAHFKVMKDGAILANSGHFNVEINIPCLAQMAKKRRTIRTYVEEFTLSDDRVIFVLGEGRLINLAAAEGHPASVMDMSFANQALCLEYLVQNKGCVNPKVYPVPEMIDKEIARLKLQSMRVKIDTLTPEQVKYLTSWEQGT
jgi:adenosylhomocysteinase